jgi:hypothetical protein
MPTRLKLVKPFFDISSVLKVELFSGARYPATLLAEEALSPAGLDIVTPTRITILSPSKGLLLPRSRHTTPVPEFRLASHQGSRHATPAPGNHSPAPRHGTPADAPYPKVVRFQWATSASREESLTSCESSSDTASDSNTLSTLLDDFKIPKPQGEPGRPGRGGYTLESALNWNHNLYVKFKASLFLRAAMYTYLVKLDHHLLPYR